MRNEATSRTSDDDDDDDDDDSHEEEEAAQQWVTRLELWLKAAFLVKRAQRL